MIAVFRTLFSRWFRPVPHLNQARARESAPELAQPFLIDHPEEAVAGHPVPYDENLLEKSRTQWQFGDWENLAKLERDTLQHHPDRAKLALLGAAGHLQTADPAQARQYIRLAQDWGCSKKLVARILAAGVHNSLGRAAAAAGNQPRALQHLESAIVVGTPGADTRLLAQARISEQFLQLGLSGGAAIKVGAGETVAAVPKLPPLAKNLETLTDTLKQQKAELDAQLKKQADEFKSLRDFLDSRLKKEVANATQQIEAFVSIQNYLGIGNGFAEFHGWPISPDIGLFLIERIRERHHDLVVEFGSGTSTALFAKTMQTIRPGAAAVYSFEHDPVYLHKTQTLLKHHGLGDQAALIHAPLIEWRDETGDYLYYDCNAMLATLAQRLAGAPGKTCANARYPAAPFIFKHLGQHEIDLVLDDANRSEEKAVIELWRAFWRQRTIQIADGKVASEKGLYWARNYDAQDGERFVVKGMP
jgi:predicted O-methyltransferase YrrM